MPFIDTILGPILEEEPPLGRPKTYEEYPDELPAFVQVHHQVGSEPILPLSKLEECNEPAMMPELIHEPQADEESPHNFGFVYEQNGNNRGKQRKEVRFLDLFSGAGGFHRGVTREPGFKGVAAVEWDETALYVAT